MSGARRGLLMLLVATALALAWWGWQTLDASLRLLGSRLC